MPCDNFAKKKGYFISFIASIINQIGIEIEQFFHQWETLVLSIHLFAVELTADRFDANSKKVLLQMLQLTECRSKFLEIESNFRTHIFMYFLCLLRKIIDRATT